MDAMFRKYLIGAALIILSYFVIKMMKPKVQPNYLDTPDIKERIYADFGEKAEVAIELLRAAIKEYDYIHHPRILRCIIFLANKNLESLVESINMATRDPRDIMYAAEYINSTRRRDFNKTFHNCEEDI